ncbi:hypothetical protein ABIA16_000355 [Sinorhizobium fredii]
MYSFLDDETLWPEAFDLGTFHDPFGIPFSGHLYDSD